MFLRKMFFTHSTPPVPREPIKIVVASHPENSKFLGYSDGDLLPGVSAFGSASGNGYNERPIKLSGMVQTTWNKATYLAFWIIGEEKGGNIHIKVTLTAEDGTSRSHEWNDRYYSTSWGFSISSDSSAPQFADILNPANIGKTVEVDIAYKFI